MSELSSPDPGCATLEELRASCSMFARIPAELARPGAQGDRRAFLEVATHQIAAAAGHMSLSEVERDTRAADRRRLVNLLLEGS